jgi:hypothetical protein
MGNRATLKKNYEDACNAIRGHTNGLLCLHFRRVPGAGGRAGRGGTDNGSPDGHGHGSAAEYRR